MAVIQIDNFGGEIPRTPARNLSSGSAQVNKNLLATATEFRPLAQKGGEVVVFGVANNPKTLYRTQREAVTGVLHPSASVGWVTKPGEFSYVKGQLPDDTTERTYYTDNDGATPPRVFDNAGGDYLLGIPRPTKPEVSLLTTKKFTLKNARDWMNATLLPEIAKQTLACLSEDFASARFTLNTADAFNPAVGTTAGTSHAGVTRLYNNTAADGNYFMYWPSTTADGKGMSQRAVFEPWNIMIRIPASLVCSEGMGNPLLGGVKVLFNSPAGNQDSDPTWIGVAVSPLWGVLDKSALKVKLQTIKRPEVSGGTENLWSAKQIDYMADTMEALLSPGHYSAVTAKRSQLDAALKAALDAGYQSVHNVARPTLNIAEADNAYASRLSAWSALRAAIVAGESETPEAYQTRIDVWVSAHPRPVQGLAENTAEFAARLAAWRDLQSSAVTAMLEKMDLCARLVNEIEAIYAKLKDDFLAEVTSWFENVRLSKTDDDFDGLVVLDTEGVSDTRFYLTTFVTAWGEESGPSEPSDQLEVEYNDLVVVKPPDRSDVSAGRNITKWRLYRSNSGSASSAFQFVSESAYVDTVPTPYAGWGNVGVDLPGFGDKDKWRDVVATWVIYTQDRGARASESPGAFRDQSKLRIGDTVVQHNGTGASGTGASYSIRKTWNGHAWVMQSTPSVAGYIGQSVYIDGLTGKNLGEVCPSIAWAPPPYRFDATVDPLPRIPTPKGTNPYLRGLIGLPNGAMAGFVDNFVAFSEAYTGYAWPVEYQLPLEFPIVGLCAFGQSVLVGTYGNPYIVSGSDPASMSPIKLSQSQSCVSRRSMVAAMGGVFYASPDGYCFASQGGVDVATVGLFSNEDWKKLNPASIFAAVHDSVLYFWYETTFGTRGCYGLDMTVKKLTQHAHYDATAVFEDVVTDAVYIANSLGISPLFHQARQLGEWKSGKLTLPSNAPLAWIRVFSDFDDSGPVTVNWYGDGVFRCATVLTSNESKRLPPGRYLEHEIEVISQQRITKVMLASTADELRAV